MLLSIIIPVFNEIQSIEKLIKIILSVKLRMEIIVIDDCSNDGSSSVLKRLLNEKKIQKLISLKKRLGKTGALKKGLKICRGDIIIIQDGDLEYDPNDYPKLIKPILNNKSKIVFGSRVLKNKFSNQTKFSKFIFFDLVNYFFTKITNFLTKQELTDAQTCYKVFTKDVKNQIKLKEKGFLFCSEFIFQVSKKNYKIFEVPIKYSRRSYKEGKKIGLKDGVMFLLFFLKKLIHR